MKQKLTSRKFWVCVAAFLASLGIGISGVATDNVVVIGIGTACSILSAAIYAAAEASVDKASVASSTTTVSASTDSSKVVETMLSVTPKDAQ